MNKNETITKEYLEKNFITKDYLDKKLDNFVTKEDLKKELAGFRISFKTEMLNETKIIFHQVAETLMESSKAYYSKEMERHMNALREGFRDDLKGYKDQVTTV